MTGTRSRVARAVLGLALAVAAVAGPALAERDAKAGADALVAVVPIQGEINALAARSFARRLEQALARAPRAVVIEIDTWGGELMAAYDIADRIARLDVDTVALVSGSAISAGALIAVAADEIAMLPETRIGDCKPIALVGNAFRTADEKIVSALRSDFESYAQRNGYPVELARKMVDENADEVLRIRWEDAKGKEHVSIVSAREAERWSFDESRRVIESQTVVGRGQLLTLKAPEAASVGFGRLVDSREALFADLEKEAGRELAVASFAAPAWEARAAILANPLVRLLLFFAGVFLVGVEITHFGAVFPGLLGLIALGLTFFGGYLTGETTALDMGLVVLGLALLAVELFVLPGFGIVGFAGVICLVVGGFLSLQAFGLPQSAHEMARFKWNLAVFAGGLVATIAAFALLLRVAPATGLVRGLVHVATERPEDGFSVASAAAVALVGRHGTAATPLRPAGKIKVGDETLDAMAQGEWIGPGEPVEIVETSENRIVVRSLRAGGGA